MNSLTYLIYRGELDENQQLVLQESGAVWKLVAQIRDARVTSQSAAYRNSATLAWTDRFAEFTDPTLAYNKSYMWRITVTDELGNESLAAVQPGVRIRRHLGRAELTGKIMLGWQPEGGTTTNWAYVLDPLAEDGLAAYSTRWLPLNEAVQNIPDLEKLYQLLVVDNRPPTAPTAAAVAHGGDGKAHSAGKTLSAAGKVLDIFSFPADWRTWNSNFGQNLSDEFYSRQGRANWQGQIAPHWSAEIAIADNDKLDANVSALLIEIGKVSQALVAGVDFAIGQTAGETLASIRQVLVGGPIADVCQIQEEDDKLILTAIDAGAAPKRAVQYLLDEEGLVNPEQPWRCAVVFAAADATKHLTITVDGTAVDFTAGVEYENGSSPEEAAANFLTAVLTSDLATKVSGFRDGFKVYLNAMSLTSTGQLDVVVLNTGSATAWDGEYEQGFSVTASSPFPAEGDEIWAFGHRILRFSTGGYGRGTGVARRYTSTPDDQSWVMMDAQMAAIAEGINTNPAVRGLKAWLEPGAHAVKIELTSAATYDPYLEYRPATVNVALQISVPTTFSWRKRTEADVVDTNLIQYGEGSGQGFWTKTGDQPSGHLHLMVDWADIMSEKDTRFSRGVIMVDGHFFAQYSPGASPDGVLEYLITSDKNAGRVLIADGLTPTVVEIRKYHPLGGYSSCHLIKICPNRTQVRRDNAQRILINSELNLAYDPWNAQLRADLVLDEQWHSKAPAWRPHFIEPQLYVTKDQFVDPATVVLLPKTDYYSGHNVHNDLRSSSVNLPDAGLYDLRNLPDMFTGAEPPAGVQVLANNYSWTRDLANDGTTMAANSKLYLRARFFDGWGLTVLGLVTGDMSIPGNASLWSLPDQAPALENYSWLIEAAGTETYLEATNPDGADPIEPAE